MESYVLPCDGNSLEHRSLDLIQDPSHPSVRVQRQRYSLFTYLVVLWAPFVCIRSLFHPFLVFRKGKEVSALVAFRNLLNSSVAKHDTRVWPTYTDNGCDKFNQEFGKLEKRWIEMIKEVDEETFDMWTVMILEQIRDTDDWNSHIDTLDRPWSSIGHNEDSRHRSNLYCVVIQGSS